MDKFLLFAMLGGYILLQLIWFIIDPRPINERFLYYMGLGKKRWTNKLFTLTVIITLITFIIFPSNELQFNLPPSLNELSLFFGVFLYLIGIVLAIWARMVMKEKWLPIGEGHDFKKQNELITNGPFSFSRNPIYLGFFLIYLGFFLAVRSYLIVTIPIFLFLYYRSILNEESILEKRFGKKYLLYKTKIRRFL